MEHTDRPTIESSSPCFKALRPHEVEMLRQKKTQLVYYAGENLFKQGAFAPYVMYLLDGLVKVYLQTGPDKQVNIRLARTGDFLAFSTIFGLDVYAYSAVALKECTVCMIDKQALGDVLLSNPEFAMQITTRNARHENHLYDIIKNVSYKQMRGKLASAILYLSDDEFASDDVFHHLSRQDLADFASISHESAIKFLKEFEKEGVVALVGKDIKIADAKKLAEVARLG